MNSPESSYMSGFETMMWNVENDPWMAPSGGSVLVYDKALDIERFRRAVAAAVAEVPRLRQRVVPSPGGVAKPRWSADTEFDLNWHIRRIGAPGNGTLRELLDWATPFFQDAYDRTRPLWQYVLVEGLEGGQGALVAKLHHTVTDGEGAIVMASKYTSLTRDGDDASEVDLEAVIAAEPPVDDSFTGVARDAFSQTVRQSARTGRRLFGRVTTPKGWRATRDGTADLVKTASAGTPDPGATLWADRSRRRHMEVLSLSFEDVRSVSKRLGGTINDFFVTGLVEAATRYHDALDSPIDHLHVSIIVSTRTADSEGNAFVPVSTQVDTPDASLTERFAVIHEALLEARSGVQGDGTIAAVAEVVNLLPSSVVSSFARSQATTLDFATSNLQGMLGDTYVAGAKTLHSYPFGPVAGAAMNVTQVSMNEFLDIGLNIDPAAITDPAMFLELLDATYTELLAAR